MSTWKLVVEEIYYFQINLCNIIVVVPYNMANINTLAIK